MAATSITHGLLNRMTRALLLDATLYEEVESDKAATRQAAIVVFVTSIILAIGSSATAGVVGLIVGVLWGFASWAIWAWLNFIIGTKLLAEPQTQADWGQLARPLGFALTPRILLVLTLIPLPFLQLVVAVSVSIWVWIAMVIAVRQALDYKSTLRAVAVTLMGFLISGLGLAGLILIGLVGR